MKTAAMTVIISMMLSASNGQDNLKVPGAIPDSLSPGKLANITVLSQRKPVSRTSDKIIYNLADGGITSSDNVYNIILKIPGVTESNGSLFYQGKPVSVLLDGRSNNLSGEDLKNYLSSFLGTNTDKLEILLNPSARYEAQGGAVFNISSKKNKNYGLTETINLGVGTGTYARYPAGFSLNFRDSNINIYGGYDLNHNKQFYQLDAILKYNSNPATVTLDDHDVRVRNNQSVRLGIDYDINKKTGVGLLFRLLHNTRRRDVVNRSINSPGTSAPDTMVNVETGGDATFTIPSLNLFLRSRPGNKGAELNINVDYFGSFKKWEDGINGVFLDKNGSAVAAPYHLINRSPAENSVKSVMTDLYYPIKNGKIEAGSKITESKTDNNVLWLQLFSSTWKTDSAKTNHFIYKEDVYAAYVSILKNMNRVVMQAGLRFEATRSNGISVTMDEITANRYNDLFPSASFQYKANKSNQFSIVFRKSIKRFGFDIINPFINSQGAYSYHQGNPYIKPSYFSSLDISWTYKNKLVAGGGFSRVKNPISYAYRKDNNSNASIGTYYNFGPGSLFTANISYTERFFKGKWTSINSAGFLHSDLPDFSLYIMHANSYNLSSVNTFSLPQKILFESTFFFNSPVLDGTVWQSALYGLALGISKPVLHSKGSLKLSCVDAFNTQILHFKTQGVGIKITSDWKVESRFVNLLFTYRFGNLNVKANKNRKTGIEEERNRMGVN